VSASTERLILEAAQRSLLEISTSNGYRTRPKRVDIAALPPTTIPFPMLRLHERSGAIAIRVVHYPPSWELRIPFRVHCHAHGRGEGAREAALADLTHDVKRRLLNDDPGLGIAGLILEQDDPDETDEGLLGVEGEAAVDFVARIISDLTD
jgi:hypothetical protein